MAKPPPAAGRSGLSFLLGALLLVAVVAVFGAIAAEISTGRRLIDLDARIATWLHANAGPALIRAMLVVSALHSVAAISAYSVVLGAVLALRRRWWHVLSLLVCVGGGMLLNVALKFAFQRARPAFDEPIVTLATYSFPSGHVAASTVFYGLGVVWLFGRTAALRWRLLALLGTALAVGLVAFSRMLLGVHYLSDVVAAFAEGVAWLIVSLAALAAMRRRLDGRTPSR